MHCFLPIYLSIYLFLLLLIIWIFFEVEKKSQYSRFSYNRAASLKKVALFIGFFWRRDDENKLTAEKMVESKYFIDKIDSFVQFYIPVFVYKQ